MDLGPLLYEGKAKQVFGTDDPDRILIRFKDDATAFNGVKKATIGDKGRINCGISAYLFDLVGREGIPHHMVRRLDDTHMLCERVEIVPVEVVVRNVVAGSMAKRYGLVEGTPLRDPLVEFFYKSDALNDPLMGEDVAVLLGWAKRWELAFMRETALELVRVLTGFYAAHAIDLIDIKFEFGRQHGRLILADELTPDGSRLWERGTGRKLDKDVFRRDLADLGDTYRELHARVFGGV